MQGNHMIDTIDGAIFHHQRGTTDAITTQFLGWLEQEAYIAFEGTTRKLLFEQVCPPNKIAVCASWPQACMIPAVCDPKP
jgi:hypothetical protein